MTMSEYSLLKKQIVYNFAVSASERHNQILNSLKDSFSSDINSPRRIQQIITLGQLLKVLEIRDVLSEDNVEPLKKMAQWIPNNNEILNKIVNYESSHVKQQSMNNYAVQKSSIEEVPKQEHPNALCTGAPSSTITTRKIQRINEVLIDEVGLFWRDLARKLEIRECQIIKIDCEHQNVADKIKKMLDIYEKKRDRNMNTWFFELLTALEKCRRKDLCKDLQKIMGMNI